MSEEIIDVEVIRFEPSSPDGSLDYYLEDVRALCKAFSFSFKIITQYVDGANPVRLYEILLDTSSFFIEDARNVIKTFILHNSMSLIGVTTIKMDSHALIEMPQDGISEVENLIVCKPRNSN